MGFQLSFGGTTFNLELSSSTIDASLVSTNFFPNTKSYDQRDRDAVIELHDFTGTLSISHPENKNEKKDSNAVRESRMRADDAPNNTKSIALQLKSKQNEINSSSTSQTPQVYKADNKGQCAREHEEMDDDDCEELINQKYADQKKGTEVHERRTDFYAIHQHNASVKQSGQEEHKSSEINNKQHESSNKSRRNSFGSDETPVLRNSLSNPKLISTASSGVNASNLDVYHNQAQLSMPKVAEEIDINIDDIIVDTDDFDDDKSRALPYEHTRAFRRTTYLHRACASPKSKVSMMFKLLKACPHDASTLDSGGNLPLHLIAQNERLLFGRWCATTEFFIDELIEAYPGALLDSNDEGFLPFATNIFSWIQEVHNNVSNETYYFDSENEIKDIPTLVHTDPLVLLSFKYLSDFVNRLENTNLDVERFNSMARLNGPAEQFVSKVSLIPSLLKTCLLIKEDKIRHKLFTCALIKRCILIDHTVGNWLVIFLANRDESSRAIEYFECLSKLTPIAVGIDLSQVTDVEHFYEKRENIITKISKMDYILPALFMLNDKDMKRACSTYPVRRILELSMTDPSLLGLLTIDLSMHLLLIIAYDAQQGLLVHTTADEYPSFFSSPVMITSTICAYMFIREEVLHAVLVKSFRKMLQKYTSSMWSFFQLLMIVFVSITNIFILTKGQSAPFELIFISKSLIWITLIGFLKGTNLHLSMFIASIRRIMFSIRWFLVVMVMVIFLFSDMMHLVVYHSHKEECDQITKNQHTLFADYCSDVLFKSSVRSVGILGGDVSLDDILELESIKVLILWLGYIFVSVIILLNVLIAIVTESYEKSSSRSHGLLGLARIPILAKHSFLDTEAKKISERGNGDFRYRIVAVVTLLFLVLFGFSYVLLFKAITAGKNGELTDSGSGIFDIVKVLLSIIFFTVANAAILVTMKDLLHIDIKKWDYCSRSHNIVLKLIHPIIKFIFNLLGVSNENKKHTFEDMEEDVLGQMSAMKEMIDSSSNRVSFNMKKIMKSVEKIHDL